MKGGKTYIYGKHAVKEALLNVPNTLKKIFLAPSFAEEDIRTLIKERGISTGTLKGSGPVDKDASHQGIVAEIAGDQLMVPFDPFIKELDMSTKPALALLGELHDPHNVGAIIRSAAALGLAGVLIPKDRQAPITGTVIKTSAGMAFRIPLVSIGNVNQTVRTLKNQGFWIYGLTGEGGNDITKETFSEPSVFIVGNEGAGIREKTEELCDVRLKIPIHTRAESLNASVAAAISFFSWSGQHPEHL